MKKVRKTAKYEKPKITKETAMVFPMKILEAKRGQLTCRQCSSCHSCR